MRKDIPCYFASQSKLPSFKTSSFIFPGWSDFLNYLMASCRLQFFLLNTWIVSECVADGQTLQLNCGCITLIWLACENSRFSTLLAAWDVSQGGTAVTQWQKFHTDDINQCLHNKFGSRGVPNANMFNFTFLLVDFGKVLCSFANELQQYSDASSWEVYIPQILTVLLQIHCIYILPLQPFVLCLLFETMARSM